MDSLCHENVPAHVGCEFSVRVHVCMSMVTSTVSNRPPTVCFCPLSAEKKMSKYAIEKRRERE